jgi:hypothetical protein
MQLMKLLSPVIKCAEHTYTQSVLGFGSQVRPSAVLLPHRTAHNLRLAGSLFVVGNLKKRTFELNQIKSNQRDSGRRLGLYIRIMTSY